MLRIHSTVLKHHTPLLFGGCWVFDSVSVVLASGKRPVPFRTRKLSLIAPMVLQPKGCGRVGHRRTYVELRVWPGRELRFSRPGPFLMPKNIPCGLARGCRPGSRARVMPDWSRVSAPQSRELTPQSRELTLQSRVSALGSRVPAPQSRMMRPRSRESRDREGSTCD
jgi:hypothetical protein